MHHKVLLIDNKIENRQCHLVDCDTHFVILGLSALSVDDMLLVLSMISFYIQTFIIPLFIASMKWVGWDSLCNVIVQEPHYCEYFIRLAHLKVDQNQLKIWYNDDFAMFFIPKCTRLPPKEQLNLQRLIIRNKWIFFLQNNYFCW